jgi:hypothetical protein
VPDRDLECFDEEQLSRELHVTAPPDEPDPVS